MLRRFLGLGLLRLLLLALALALLAAAPFASPGADYHGWHFFPVVLGPVFATIMMFVLPLDITMSRIMMAEAQGAARERYRLAIMVESVAMLLLLLAWIPYMLKLSQL